MDIKLAIVINSIIDISESISELEVNIKNNSIDTSTKILSINDVNPVDLNQFDIFIFYSVLTSPYWEKNKRMLHSLISKKEIIIIDDTSVLSNFGSNYPYFFDDGNKEMGKVLEAISILSLRIMLERELKGEIKPRNEFIKVGNEKLYLHSSVMKKLLVKLKNVAKHDKPILLYGERGTGKELLARYIHDNSNRRDKKYRIINFAGLNYELIRSELFGYKAGAFTGANKDKEGLVKSCEGGTLVLDEIATADLSIQSVLLRLIQQGEYVILGDTIIQKSNVRFIASTNRDIYDDKVFLQDLKDRFREYRVPPLRERKDEIDIFIDRFLKEANEAYKKQCYLSQDCIEKIWASPLDGNIRMLKRAIDEAVLQSDADRITELEL